MIQGTPQSYSIKLGNEEPSKWWALGLAIGIAIMTIFSGLGAIVNLLMPYDLLLANWNPEEPGLFPENGTSEEQNSWNASNEEWGIYENVTNMFDEMQGGIAQQVCFFSLFSGVIATIACTMLVQRDQRGFKMAGAWLLTSLISQVITTIQYTKITSSLYPEDLHWISAISLGSNIAGTAICNLFFLGIILVCATKHKGKTSMPESGFHINKQLPKGNSE